MYLDYFVHDEMCEVSCRPAKPGASGCLQIGAVSIFLSNDRLEEIRGSIDAALHEERSGRQPIPAEAVVDVDDLLTSMALSYEVRR